MSFVQNISTENFKCGSVTKGHALYSTFQKLKVRKTGFINFIYSICESKEPLNGLFSGKIYIFK